jgi:large subunit ribosomal protein L7/L12
VEAVEEPPKVKDIFELKLKVVDAKAKIKIIKEVRTITGLGLKEAKDLVEKAPCIVKDNLSKADADKFLKVLVEAGAEAELV